MRSASRRLLFAAITVICVMAVGVSGSFADTHKSSTTRLEKQYTSLYYTVAHHHGARVPGRNIRRYGVKTKHGVRAAKKAELSRSIRTFKRWLAPPAAPVRAGDQRPSTVRVAATPQAAGGRYSIPSYIVQCESHGNYNARNPSGAYGAYQIMPGTAAAYGCSLATPAGQDACAAKIYAHDGASAWSCG